MSLRVLVHGANGRMGIACMSALKTDAAATLAFAIDRTAGEVNGFAVTTNLEGAMKLADVVIDFSAPVATQALLELCIAQKKPVVVGTTGLDASVHAVAKSLAATTPIVVAANMSPGVAVLMHLVRRAAELLGPDYDAEIIETHHRRKVDAPSGTALRLAEAVADAKSLELENAARHGRHGSVGARTATEIGIHAVRAGDVIGDHTVILAGSEERIELTHKAHSRDLFARGAVRAAHWVVGKAPGLYDMSDVLGVRR
ncbi:MAG: 4-hydroxy-tetrahydrodipicolinate reductase [Sandaracinaceae bacterium]|jgi:4-hydroxy-tetrahydrodipicolinate reductase|nr:4-hydroxy-tetrahydrodipicolinate reductase [Sandaracinaceae bacterium]